MSSLEERINQYNEQKKANVPAEILDVMDLATRELKQTGIENGCIKTGDVFPDFALVNHLGEPRQLSELLGNSMLVINFYRGGWCPYCNLELNELRKILPEIEAANAHLIAISPETPDNSLSTRERNEISFDVLFDEGNRLSKQLGLVFKLPESLRPIYDKFGLDIPAYNGDDSFELPVPATYVVNQEGKIIFDFIDADYTRRLEPAEIIKQLQKR